jgi:hypothetical protein
MKTYLCKIDSNHAISGKCLLQIASHKVLNVFSIKWPQKEVLVATAGVALICNNMCLPFALNVDAEVG